MGQNFLKVKKGENNPVHNILFPFVILNYQLINDKIYLAWNCFSLNWTVKDQSWKINDDIILVFVFAVGVQDPHLSLQHQQPGTHLSGRPEGPVEPRPHHLQGATVGDQPTGRL